MWCSPEFEGAKLGKYQLGSAQPSSSDPGTIYRLLKHSIKTGDQHDSKIVDQKASMKALSVSLAASGKISVSDRDEIVAMVDASNLHDWRPLIYVIPYALVATRAKLVDRSKRASNEPEYIIDDLVDGEFRIIEPESGI